MSVAALPSSYVARVTASGRCSPLSSYTFPVRYASSRAARGRRATYVSGFSLETRRDSLELRIDREVSPATGPQGHEHATRDGRLELSCVDEAATR